MRRAGGGSARSAAEPRSGGGVAELAQPHLPGTASSRTARSLGLMVLAGCGEGQSFSLALVWGDRRGAGGRPALCVSAPVSWLKILDGALQQPAHLYMSAPRKWRQEEATSSSFPPPLSRSKLVNLHHLPSAGEAATLQHPTQRPRFLQLPGKNIPVARCQARVVLSSLYTAGAG